MIFNCVILLAICTTIIHSILHISVYNIMSWVEGLIVYYFESMTLEIGNYRIQAHQSVLDFERLFYF